MSNWIDSAIGYFSPRAGLERAQMRMALDVLRKYDAATVGRRTEGWHPTGGSGSAELLHGFDRVRNRARDMVRNNEYAKKAVQTLATKIVGTGITTIPDDVQEREAWRRWGEEECDAGGELDLFGLQRLAAIAWKESGECLVRRRWRKASDGLRIPMQLQLLEPDHLDHQKTGPLDNGNVAIMGVEYDALGRRAAYWLYPEHPGEVATLRRGAGLQSKRVPASEVIHLYRKDRISQVRGMSELAVSLLRMRDLQGYEQAELVRKKIEACFTAFVTTDEPRTTIGEVKQQADGRKQEKLSPGLIKYLTTGESVTFGTPQATGGYAEYTGTQLHAIAVGSGVTYHQLTGDTSRSSYTSHRAATREFYDLIDAEQWLTFIPMVVRPVRRWWRDAAQIAGVRLGDKPDRITTPRKQMVDPLKDTTADKEEIRAGLKSLSEALRERGEDFDTVVEEIKRERDRLAELGITLDIDAMVKDLKLNPADVLDGNTAATKTDDGKDD